MRRADKLEVFHDGQPISRRALPGLVKRDLADEGFIPASAITQSTGISADKLKRWCEKGLIVGKKVKRSWFYSRSDVVRAIKDGH